ncbi:MAG: hypothetical protein V1933_03720 [Candidatus Omnitrophota bacterium]
MPLQFYYLATKHYKFHIFKAIFDNSDDRSLTSLNLKREKGPVPRTGRLFVCKRKAAAIQLQVYGSLWGFYYFSHNAKTHLPDGAALAAEKVR